MPNIFEYFDYHKYLMDYYKERKAAQSFFSYRYMSKRLDIDAGYLVKVFQGKKNISSDSVPKFVELMCLTKKEAHYFELLTHFSKAKTHDELSGYFEKLLPFTSKSPDKIELRNYEFYKRWYYAAVREILGFYTFKGNFAELAEIVQPPIKPSEAKKAVNLLEKIGLIIKNDKNEYSLTSRFTTTGEVWRSIAVHKYQKEVLHLAVDALENIPKDERDFSTITMSLSKEGFNIIRDELKQFRQRVFAVLENEKLVNRAYQLNLQLFPISKNPEGEQSE